MLIVIFNKSFQEHQDAKLANFASRIDALLDSGVKVVTT